jgi:uncharacterized protein (TIGR03086 family)
MHDLHPATRLLASLVEDVDDAQLGAPTPCPDYTVGDLVDHIGGLAVAFTAAARKEDGVNASPPPPGDGARLTDDWRARIPRDLATMADAWADAAAWDGMTKIGGGEAPAAVAGAVGLNEVIAHGWDLACATGQRFAPDAADLEACIELMTPMSQPGMDAVREPAFGPVVTSTDQAPPLERLLALTGREPGWSA